MANLTNPRGNPWPVGLLRRAERLHDEGKTVREIATIIGKTEASVYKKLRRAEPSRQTRGRRGGRLDWRNARHLPKRAAALQLLDAGLEPADVAARTGLALRTVQKYQRKELALYHDEISRPDE